MPENKELSLPPISAGIINYNGGETLFETISSILNCGYQNEIDLIVVDDGSTDGGPEIARERFPSVRVFIQPENMGPNAARNKILKEAKHEIVFISDNDIEPALGCLDKLVTVMIGDDNVAVATPMVLDSVNRDTVYSNGSALHYVCFGVIPDRYKKAEEITDLTPRKSICGSGGTILAKRDVALSLDGFDESFVFGYDDGEFTYRISGAGYDVIHVPEAKIYHLEKTGGRAPNRLRFQIKGRLSLIAKTYATRTFILLAPALIFFELAQIFFLLLKGQLGEWLNGVSMVFSERHEILKKRKVFMAVKQRPDKDLLTDEEFFMFSSRLGPGMSILKKGMDKFLSLYWSILSPLLVK